MKLRNACMLFAALCVLWPSFSMAQLGQSEVTDTEWARGFNGFALICRSLGLEPIANLSEFRRIDATQSIWVVFGSRPTSGTRYTDLRRFISQGGAVLFASDRHHNLFDGDIRFVFDRYRGYLKVDDPRFMFDNHADCLIVRDFPNNHPVVNGIERIVTNRTAGLDIKKRSIWQPIATLPKLSNRNSTPHLLATSTSESRRVLVCADQSIFSNQMLFHGDNARFTLQAMHWLKQGQRTNLLILNNDQLINPEDPQAMNVEFPPPSREDVWNAIQQLPPDLLLEFGNEIATLVEDENLVNELMSLAMEDVSDTHFVRLLIFLSTFLLAGFLFYRYMRSESTLQDAVGTETRDLASPGLGWFARRRKAAHDRITVARELVTRFYNMVSGGHHDHYFGFPANLRFVNCDNQKELEKGMRQTGKFLKGKSRRWWTQERLKGLRGQIDYWEHLHANQQLVFVPDHNFDIAEPPIQSTTPDVAKTRAED